MSRLAGLRERQGRFADGEVFVNRALAILEKRFDSNHPQVANSVSSLANLYLREGRLEEAAQLYERTLVIREKEFGPDNLNVAFSLFRLGNLHQRWGRYADAESFYQRALAVRKKILSPDHPQYAASLNSLADLYKTQNRYADALPLVQTAVRNGGARPAVVAGAARCERSGLDFRGQRAGRRPQCCPARFAKFGCRCRCKARGPPCPPGTTAWPCWSVRTRI